MAKSHYIQQHYTSRDFVESAGTILFDFRRTGISVQQLLSWNQDDNHSKQQFQPNTEPTIALVYSGPRNQTLLAKGRRNINEPRGNAAVRETYEETGLRCRLLPVSLHSRATSVDPTQDRVNEAGFTANEVRHFKQSTDSFWMTIRRHPDDEDVKVIWWFIAVVEETQDAKPIEIDPGCEMRAMSMSKAAEACTFEDDRKVVNEAIAIVRATFGL